MRLMIGFAGIPQPVFDFFRRAERELLEKGDVSLAESCKRFDPGYMADRHAGFFLQRFADALADDHHNLLADVGFAIVYVSSHEGSEAFAERLFPSVLCIPVAWELDGYNRTTLGRSFGVLRQELRSSVQRARRAIPTIKREVTQHDGRTPLLLPIRNFRSDTLIPTLKAVERGIAEEGSGDVLTDARRRFEHVHPPQKVGIRKRACFVDDAGLEFHPPGSARHGFARETFAGHPPSCLVGGRRRLGSPYDRAFHYDCQRQGRTLNGEFPTCHGDSVSRKKVDYLNIAPNDNVRG